MAPAPNPRVLAELGRADAVLFGMGSLYTSIVPSLILRGMGECIAATHVPKVSEGRGKSARRRRLPPAVAPCLGRL